jgi:hypothetical protein
VRSSRNREQFSVLGSISSLAPRAQDDERFGASLFREADRVIVRDLPRSFAFPFLPTLFAMLSPDALYLDAVSSNSLHIA